MLQIAVCDDEPMITSKIEQLLEKVSAISDTEISIDVFFDGKTLSNQVREGKRYDIIYLDIEMKDQNGVEAAKEIRKYDTEVLLIFVTSYESFAKDVFEVSAFRFLTKPIDKIKFEQYFKDAKDKIMAQPSYFQYQYDKTNYRIPITEILYFQSDKRITYIITTSGEYKKCYIKLNDIEKKFTESNIVFYRIHQSFYVNPEYVSAYTYDSMVLTDRTTLTISEKRRKKINELFCRLKGEDIIVS